MTDTTSAPCRHNVFRYTDSVTGKREWFCSVCGFDFAADGTLPLVGKVNEDGGHEQVIWASPAGISYVCDVINADTGFIYNPELDEYLTVTQELVWTGRPPRPTAPTVSKNPLDAVPAGTVWEQIPLEDLLDELIAQAHEESSS